MQDHLRYRKAMRDKLAAIKAKIWEEDQVGIVRESYIAGLIALEARGVYISMEFMIQT